MTYSRQNPYLAKLTDRYRLNREDSKKLTYHLSVSLEGSGIDYQTGDCIGIYPRNPQALVEKTLEVIGSKGDERVTLRGKEEPVTFAEALSSQLSITKVPKKILTLIADKQSDPTKLAQLQHLLSKEGRDELKAYLNERELWDCLLDHPEVKLEPQEICNALTLLMPRLYSIASSPLASPQETHLTMAHVSYETNGHPRVGICSEFLVNGVDLNDPVLPVYLHPTTGFRLPEDPNAHVIMVGPGTGIAPFRAFMQERVARGDQGASWLFFGEWNRGSDYYYEDYWTELVNSGKLRLDLAFSRDQQHKVYVQHRMLEQGKDLWAALDSGAYFFVCGDANHMAKDVDTALHEIIQVHGGKDEEEAKAYVKAMKQDKRYLRDVY